MPDPTVVLHKGGYDIRPCPAAEPSAGTSWLTPRILDAERSDARLSQYGATRLIDAGPLDLRDGVLLVPGGEALPSPDVSGLRVPKGTPRVSLLVADLRSGKGWSVAAVEIRFSAGVPARWREEVKLAGGTDAGIMGLAGKSAAERLSDVRGFEESISESRPEFWLTPCRRFYRTRDKTPEVASAVEVSLNGDGGWPGAVGYDDAGQPVAAIISTGVLPWSMFGLSGQPPPEAVADEPSAAPSMSTASG